MIKGIENRKEEYRSGWGRENERPRKEWKKKKNNRELLLCHQRDKGVVLCSKKVQGIMGKKIQKKDK